MLSVGEAWDKFPGVRGVLRKGYPKSGRPVREVVSLPCVHEGAIIEWCNGCPASAEAKHVRDCDLHEKCTRKFVSDKVTSCDRCPDRVPDLGDWKYVSKGRAADSAADLRAAADAFVANLPERGGTKGRGIAISGGGKYLPSVYITTRAIRHVGCTLPIQVWYYGDSEGHGERYQELLSSYGVTFIDADAHRAPRRKLWKYAIKTFAAYHCEFEEVLHLDADSYPVVPLDPLFNESRYVESGGTFWPDIAVADKWCRFDLFKVNPDSFNAWETGQWLINKSVAWDVLSLAYWYDQHSDYTWYYGHGDTGTWRAAWAYFNRQPAFYAKRPDWVGACYLQMGPDGITPQFVHRCRDKFRVNDSHFYTGQHHDAPTFDGRIPLENECFQWLEELKKGL